MNTNDSPDPAKRPPRSARWQVAVLLLLLAGYVLSIGPTARLVVDGTLRNATWLKLYYPLIVLSDYVLPADLALQWYVKQWGADFGFLVVLGRSGF